MGYAYVSDDGLLSTTDLAVVTRWNEGLARAKNDGQAWTERLRAVGVVLAHPDDGWVHRQDDGTGSFSLSWYPLFCDVRYGLKPGMLVAFGCPPSANRWDPDACYYQPRREYDLRRGFRNKYAKPESADHGYRICEVVEVRQDGASILGYGMAFTYRDTGVRYPDAEPTPLADRHPRVASLVRADRWDR